MSELILNVHAAPPARPRAAPRGNRKHRRFLRRRRAERRRRGPSREPEPARASPSSEPGGSGSPGPAAPPGGAAEAAVVAIDCEMVGTGPGGRHSALARCSIVGYGGAVLYDRYVRPAAPVVDFRTRWSGIRRHHMARAVPFVAARKEILRILAGKLVVGHAIYNDFKALKYFHPQALTRDTSKMPLLNRKGGFPENATVSLKRLAKELLHKDIQVGKSGHSSVEDARTTMELYKVVEVEWEQHLLLTPKQE
ncbi:interferon-stimulated 20 kDa exonuclease-like 2 [Pezoporus wallicus]|uniref:interferon-stimulated 20 kDa exonuclease-like 2 n=1 Tax=Pezoporus wallicus TaxID=35540 RepID=UPI002550B129|nr:interferon-stimulated 20 kDa exonuclease-like 2 [Pezoporus wallicus]